MRPSNLREAYPQIRYVSHRSILNSCLVFKRMQNHHCIVWHNRYTTWFYHLIIITTDYIHEWVQCALGTVRPCRLASNIYGCLIIRYMCRLSSWEIACEIVWWNNCEDSSVVLSLCSSRKMVCIVWCKCLWNHYPGKWQAMHDANACENYIAIILWQQSPCFKCMWNHQCIATQSPCDYRLSIKPPLLNKNHQCIATQSPCYCRLFIKPTLKKNYMNLNDGNAGENYIAIILWWQSPCFKCVKSSMYCDTVLVDCL